MEKRSPIQKSIIRHKLKESGKRFGAMHVSSKVKALSKLKK